MGISQRGLVNAGCSRTLRDIYLQRSHLRCYEGGRKSLKVTIGVQKVCIVLG